VRPYKVTLHFTRYSALLSCTVVPRTLDFPSFQAPHSPHFTRTHSHDKKCHQRLQCLQTTLKKPSLFSLQALLCTLDQFQQTWTVVSDIFSSRGKVFEIGTARYNWPMSAHVSQAFSIAHCTDSEDLPSHVLNGHTGTERNAQ